MAPRNRALFALVGLFSALATGCSGGKSSGGGTPPTASPTSTPTVAPTATGSASASATPTGAATPTATPFVLMTATPIPAATSAPSGNPLSVATRPLGNGDVFSYSGTTSQSFVYSGATPNPSASSIASVTQRVTVATGKTYNGASGLDDFTTTETDTGPNATTTITTDAYYALTTGPTGQQALTTYGSTSSDSGGQSLAIALASPGFANNSGTVDLVPEQRSPTWTNGAAQTIVQKEGDGFSATRTYAANGSYVENATYPQTTAASPQPSPLTATITQNADGSGTYALPLFGPPNITFTFNAPTSAGLINITACCDSSNQPLPFAAQVSAWFAQPIALYSEIDRDNGAVAYPSGCNVSGTFGTQGNQIEQKFTRTDTILGTLEFFDQLTYVASNGVAACVSLKDVTYVYYDYSGQTNTNAGVGFNGGNSPYETQTIVTTLGITGSPTLNSTGRRTDSVARAISAPAVANARANFLHTIDRYRAQRERTLFAHLRSHLARVQR